MLRILHTADWHLGQVLHGYDREYEHGCFLDWLLEQIRVRKPDALFVSGDVFDTVNPSANAQRLLYRFLARAYALHPTLQTILVAGNHDAGARLEAPAAITENLNVRIVGTVPRSATGEVDFARLCFPLRDASGEVRAVAVATPFLRPGDVPSTSTVGDAYTAGMRTFYEMAVARAAAMRAEEWPGVPLVALGHCHVAGGVETGGAERRVWMTGGADAMEATVFPPALRYVALGHLHQRQSHDQGRVQYCGSPIPLSFSEIDYEHAILEVDIDGADVCSVLPVRVPRCVPLMRIPRHGASRLPSLVAELESLGLAAALSPEAYPFLEVRVLDDGPDPTRTRTIEKALQQKPVRLARITSVRPVAEPAQGVAEVLTAPLEDLSALDPEEILISVHLERYGTEPDEAVMSAFRAILHEESVGGRC